MSITTRPVPAPATTLSAPTPPTSRLTLGGGTRWRSWLLPLTGVVLLLGTWELVPRFGLADPVFLPSFSTVATAWWDLLISGQLWPNVRISGIRSLTGFSLAVVVGIPLGFAIAANRTLSAILNPVLELFRNTAALAILPAFILILGIGETSKIAIIFYASVWPVLLNTISGARDVDPLLIKSARSLALSPVRIFTKVVLPASVPTVFTGIRLAGANSILVLIAAELVGSTAGLGFFINNAQYNFQVPRMYAGIVTISVLGLLFNQALVLLERHFTRWKP